MKFIGITGGIGAGKSELLQYIQTKYRAKILLTDEVAKMLQEPGEELYEPLVALLGKTVLLEDGRIDKKKMANCIFAKQSLLAQINALVHPAVTRYVLTQKNLAKEEGKLDFFFVEAALLIENGFGELCDELWYIYAKPQTRIERLMAGRGYTKEKCESIMNKQLSDEEFRKNCKVIIDNSGSLEESFAQIDRALL